MQPQSTVFRRPLPADGAHPSPGRPDSRYDAGGASAGGGVAAALRRGRPGTLPSGNPPTTTTTTTTNAQAYGGAGGGGAGAPHAVVQAKEQENDELMRALLQDVRAAKASFTAVGGEVRRQNTLLEDLERRMGSARGALAATMRRLRRADSAGSFAHMWLLFVFVFVFFVLLYLLIRFR